MRPVVIGLTGGIGVGKSTVATLLSAHGASIIDVDRLGRDVLAGDGDASAAVIAAFGPGIVAGSGRIDRAELARMVFGAEAGSGRLRELEAITHPAINERLDAIIGEAHGGEGVLVLDMAVLVDSELGRGPQGPIYDRVIVVEAPLEVRMTRLIDRGLARVEAEARVAAQPDDAQRRAVADVVVVNDGSRDRLAALIADVWPTIEAWSLQAAASTAVGDA